MNTLLLTLANMGVNLDDVADVVNNCIPQLIFFGVVVAAAIIVLIAMAVNKKLAKPTKFMVRAQSGLAVLLAFGIMLNLVAFGPMSTMLDLVTGNGTITEESGAEANALCTEIAEEGIVLLQNDDNELPLASGSNLNVFGWASVGPVYGGTGAGAISADRPTVSLLDGLHNAGINTNTELSDFYTAYCAERPALGYSNHNWTLPEPTAASYTQELIDNAKSFSDTAMVVISRVGGEMADLPTNMDGLNYTENSTEYNDFEPGQHYLSLTKTEKNRIYEKMFSMGIRNLSAYIRKMALDGYCLNLDLPQLRRMAYLLQNCSNNLNQYAKRANECGKVYAADMEDLRQRLDELIDIGKQILSKLAEL